MAGKLKEQKAVIWSLWDTSGTGTGFDLLSRDLISRTEKVVPETLGPRTPLTFDVMRGFRDTWNRDPILEADTVKALVQYLVTLDDKWQLSNKKNQVRLRQPPTTSVIGEKAWTEDERFERAITGMLNKLTPAKYADVIKSFDLTRMCQDEKKTKMAVKRIFEKALQEPCYLQLYAQVCSDVLRDNKTEHAMEFRKQMVNSAKSAFEEMKFMTIIKFMGELYLSKVFHVGIIHCVITALLGNKDSLPPDDTRVEMLCTLLELVGSRLEQTNCALLDQTMAEIAELLEVSGLPDALLKAYQPRTVFLLMGILETQRLLWVPRVAKGAGGTMKKATQLGRTLTLESMRGFRDTPHMPGPCNTVKAAAQDPIRAREEEEAQPPPVRVEKQKALEEKPKAKGRRHR